MYVRGTTFVSRPITTSASEEQIDTVKALLLDHAAHQILGFIVDRGGWAGSARLLQWSDARVGPGAIEILDTGAGIRLAAHEPYVEHLIRTHPIFPTVSALKIISNDHYVIGRLNDVKIVPNSGRIHSYEIWRGLPLLGRRITLQAQELELGYSKGMLVIRQQLASLSGLHARTHGADHTKLDHPRFSSP